MFGKVSRENIGAANMIKNLAKNKTEEDQLLTELSIQFSLEVFFPLILINFIKDPEMSLLMNDINLSEIQFDGSSVESSLEGDFFTDIEQTENTSYCDFQCKIINLIIYYSFNETKES